MRARCDSTRLYTRSLIFGVLEPGVWFGCDFGSLKRDCIVHIFIDRLSTKYIFLLEKQGKHFHANYVVREGII